MAGDPKAHVTFGFGDAEVSVPVYDRSLPYVLRRVGAVIDQLQQSDLDADQSLNAVVDFVMANAYEGLAALMPNLPKRMPEHTFKGFASKAAMEAGEYDDDAAQQAASASQIKHAAKTALTVLGLDFTTLLKNWVDPTLLRPAINLRVAEWISGISPSSPSESGDTTPNGSGESKTTQPTSSDQALEASLA